MSTAPTYTDLMAHKLYMDELNSFLLKREAELLQQLSDANEACLQLGRETDQLQAELDKARAEIRALKRQLLAH